VYSDLKLNSKKEVGSLFVLKWLIQNVRGRVTYALKHPGYALNALMRELTLSDERFLAQVSGVSARQIRSFLDEPINTPEFANHIRSAKDRFTSLSMKSADLYAKRVLNQYAVVRALKPECIVETGIANGVSSSYILLALHKNGRGRLHSIGLEDPAFLPPDQKLGWLVPDWLRPSWQTHLGDACEILPKLAIQLQHISIFIHDSLHTYDHMMWEFKTIYPHLQSGGLLLADDALWNEAFNDFARDVNASEAQILRGVGFLRKLST
jgi:Methyltransferase domain